MAKKNAKKDESATPTKAPAKESAKTSKKAPAAKAAAPAATETASSNAKAPKAAAPKAAKPKAAPIKLTDTQKEMHKKVHGAGEAGYSAEKPIEQRSLDALVKHKLIKKGAKNKETGKFSYTVSAAGKKHLESQGGGSSS